MDLTRREAEIVDLICEGLGNAAIGKQLGVTRRTVESHITNALAKNKGRNRTDLMRMRINERKGVTA